MQVELQAYTVPIIEGVTHEDFTAYIARIGKVKDDPEKLLRYLLKHKHWSPFEHSYVTFKVRTSRAIGRELLRHRSFTFQELSQRYEEVLEFEDIEIRRQSEKNRQSSDEVFNPIIFEVSVEESLIADPIDDYILGRNEMKADQGISLCLSVIQEIYGNLLKAGVARECARMILPECTSTTILMTGNIRSWIHFLGLRDHENAQKEARLVAIEIKKILLNIFPIIFKAIEDGNQVQ